jgi:hypothetical protein
MAFGSKFLYFADPRGRALILDFLLRAWLAEHTAVRPRGGRDEREYAMWLLIAEQWARALKITGEELELGIFTDALPRTRRGGRRRTPSCPSDRHRIGEHDPAGSRPAARTWFCSGA